MFVIINIKESFTQVCRAVCDLYPYKISHAYLPWSISYCHHASAFLFYVLQKLLNQSSIFFKDLLPHRISRSYIKWC